MSIRNFQTQTGTVLHLLRPTDQDLRLVEDLCHLHPLDAEQMFQVHEQSSVGSYHDYHTLNLCLPWVDHGQHVSVDLMFVVSAHHLIVAHDTPDQFIKDVLKRRIILPHSTSFSLLTDILQELTTKTEALLTPSLSRDARPYLVSAWEAIDSLATKISSQLEATELVAYRLAVHRLKHLDRLLDQPRALSSASLVDRFPQAALRYAAASVVLFMTVLWALR